MLFGIDVASVDENHDVNWALAKAQGPISFAIIRATQATHVDGQFAATWPKLEATGLVRGAYMFLDFPRLGAGAAGPDIQAQTLIDTVGPLSTDDLPPALDIEFPHGRAATGMSVNAALEWIRVAWATLRDWYKVPPILYTSGRVWHEDLDDAPVTELLDSPLWLARYFWTTKAPAMRDASQFANGLHAPPVPTPWGSAWAIHQYQGDALAMPGFTSTVDMNRFNTLVQGATGDAVRWAQRRLRVVADGNFGPITAGAVRSFQHTHGMVADGIVGPRTFAKLCWQD
ncbi:MAG: GH25 family lysozyme [Kofleriaceae bacterium]